MIELELMGILRVIYKLWYWLCQKWLSTNKSYKSSSCSVHKADYLSWSSVSLESWRSNSSEGLDLPARIRANRQTGKKQKTKTSFFCVFYIGCHQNMWSRFKVDLSSLLKRSRLKWVFLLQIISLSKRSSQVYPGTWDFG